ncbi:MAG: hypothetical protein ACREBW_06775, partial [Candidatus Micrarchaeaceae archaeon]
MTAKLLKNMACHHCHQMSPDKFIKSLVKTENGISKECWLMPVLSGASGDIQLSHSESILYKFDDLVTP